MTILAQSVSGPHRHSESLCQPPERHPPMKVHFPFTYQRPLKLGYRSDHLKQHFPGWHRGYPRLRSLRQNQFRVRDKAPSPRLGSSGIRQNGQISKRPPHRWHDADNPSIVRRGRVAWGLLIGGVTPFSIPPKESLSPAERSLSINQAFVRQTPSGVPVDFALIPHHILGESI